MSDERMRALTLWQPWASIVASGVKLIENRPWAPPAKLLGERIAIHAGMRWDQPSDDKYMELRWPGDPVYLRGEVPQGAVIATARVERFARSVSEIPDDQHRWFFGPFCWVLADVNALERPIECPGRQRVWRLSSEVTAEVRKQCGGIL